MLVLSRRKNEAIWFKVEGVLVRAMLLDIRGDKIRLGIDAPPSVNVIREELLEQPELLARRERLIVEKHAGGQPTAASSGGS